jgi:aryl-alcohol dehydrogenase-like predicted oxidoreductase
VLADAQVLDALARLRAAGLPVGLTLSGPNQARTLRQAVDIRVDGAPLFDCVQATWNLLEPAAGPALADAHAGGMGVIIKEGLANGRLTARGGSTDGGRLLARVAARLRTTPDALALAAVLAQPWADVVLSGAATPEHLAANVSALQVRWDDAAAAELASLVETPAEYWATRAKLAWN